MVIDDFSIFLFAKEIGKLSKINFGGLLTLFWVILDHSGHFWLLPIFADFLDFWSSVRGVCRNLQIVWFLESDDDNDDTTRHGNTWSWSAPPPGDEIPREDLPSLRPISPSDPEDFRQAKKSKFFFLFPVGRYRGLQNHKKKQYPTEAAVAADWKWGVWGCGAPPLGKKSLVYVLVFGLNLTLIIEIKNTTHPNIKQIKIVGQN